MDVVTRKSNVEIARMQQAATRLMALFTQMTHDELAGASGVIVDRQVRRFLTRNGLQSAMVGYRGYPAHCSVSPNDVAVHGVPGARKMGRGDVVTLDIAAVSGGWFCDTAWTYLFPGVSHRVREEYGRSWDAFRSLLGVLRPGMTLADLSDHAVRLAAQRQLAIIPEFTGHGIGRLLHEPPVIAFAADGDAYREQARRIRLYDGMVMNVEPVFRGAKGPDDAGFGYGVELDVDGWGYRTTDGRETYHFELTVAVKEGRIVVLQLGGLDARDLPENVPFGDFVSVAGD